jgi:hypothetical protein
MNEQRHDQAVHHKYENEQTGRDDVEFYGDAGSEFFFQRHGSV